LTADVGYYHAIMGKRLKRLSEVSERRGRPWTAQEVADFFTVPLGTVYSWRYKGEGPPGFRAGRHLRFFEEDVIAWAEARREGAK
jgi:hypothetical protein